jgi:PKD repeat protein
MVPQITCPYCGNTIGLENRKEVDFERIMCAIGKSPRTFTELLTLTNLPRKTLSLRLKELCASGSILKDGGYHLNPSIASANGTFRKKYGNGKMNQTILHIRKNVQWIPVALIICLMVVAFGSAMMISPPSPSAPPTASFFYVPSSNMGASSNLTFDAASSRASNGPITDYTWDFGDASSLVHGQVVTHAYAVDGAYTVTLTVEDSHGLTSSTQETVNLSALVYVDHIPSQYQVGDNITLNIMISGVTNLFAWQAGMTFNATVLKCDETAAPGNSAVNGTTAFTEGSFLGNSSDTLWFPAAINEDGVIPYQGCTLLGATTHGVSGRGVLALVKFTVIGEGPLNIRLTDVALLNPDGTEIPIDVAT